MHCMEDMLRMNDNYALCISKAHSATHIYYKPLLLSLVDDFPLDLSLSSSLDSTPATEATNQMMSDLHRI